jgi:hypothetical protein
VLICTYIACLFPGTSRDSFTLIANMNLGFVSPCIFMDLQEFRGGRGDWMELAQDRDRWRALVGMVRDFRVP